MAIFDLKDRNVRAVGKRIIVQKAVRPKMSAGGIVLPDEDVRVYCEGTVLSVGPKVENAKVGEQIIWEVFKGQAAGHHDEHRWAIEDEHVIGVLETDKQVTLPAGVKHNRIGSLCAVPNCGEVHDPAPVSDARPTPKAR